MADSIEIFVDGRNFGKKYGTAFAVVLRSGQHVWERSFDCGDITANEAALRAVEFGLKSIKIEHRNKDIILVTNNKYVSTMLEKEDSGHWKKNAKVNAELINRIRETLDKQFSNIKIEDTSDNEMASRVKDLSSMVAKDRKAVNVQG